MKEGKHSFRTSGSCAREISFDVRDGKVYDIQFNGGCNGNLKMIAKLLDGSSPEDIASKCSGNTCGMKSTSCADQLARAMLKEE